MSTLSHAHRRTLGAVCAAAATLLIATGCSGSSSTSTSTSTEQTADRVTISNHMFQAPASVKAGAQVTVRNDDSDEHTVTSTTGGVFDTEVAGKSTVTFTAPTAPGSYDFFCKYHPAMKATLVVS